MTGNYMKNIVILCAPPRSLRLCGKSNPAPRNKIYRRAAESTEKKKGVNYFYRVISRLGNSHIAYTTLDRDEL